MHFEPSGGEPSDHTSERNTHSERLRQVRKQHLHVAGETVTGLYVTLKARLLDEVQSRSGGRGLANQTEGRWKRLTTCVGP